MDSGNGSQSDDELLQLFDPLGQLFDLFVEGHGGLDVALFQVDIIEGDLLELGDYIGLTVSGNEEIVTFGTEIGEITSFFGFGIPSKSAHCCSYLFRAIELQLTRICIRYYWPH